ncbi:MAG: secretion system protein [Firmicutes bacterium]|nr:secretion system protein [Bacillota bacterium]
MKLLLISALVFSSVFIFCCILINKLQDKTALERRLSLISKPRDFHEHTETEFDNELEKDGIVKLFLRKINYYLELKPSHNLSIELVRADINLTAGEFLILNVLLAAAPLFLVFFGYSLITALLMAVVGLTVPSLYIKRRQRKRVQKTVLQLPEALITIANSLKAGYSFLQAMELVSQEADPPIAAEFALVIKEMNLGATTEVALQNMVERINSDDMDLVVTAVLIQRQVGGNLSEILESIAHTIRERIRIKGEINTLTAQGRISGMIIGALPFVLGLFLFMVNPEYIKPLFNESLGQLMLGLGIGGQILAVIIIRKIVNIQV